MKQIKLPIGLVFMLAMIHERQIIVVLDFPNDIDDFITYSGRIYTTMNGNSIFSGLSAKLTTLNTLNGVLVSKQTNIKTVPPTATTEERDEALVDVKNALRGLKGDVQTMVYAAPDSDAAQVIVVAAGMKVKQMGVINKEAFKVQDGVSGTVELIARGMHNVHYANNWERSQDGTNWIPIPPTLAAHTSVPGLVRASQWDFRHQYILKDGPTDWTYVYDWVVR